MNPLISSATKKLHDDEQLQYHERSPVSQSRNFQSYTPETFTSEIKYKIKVILTGCLRAYDKSPNPTYHTALTTIKIELKETIYAVISTSNSHISNL